LTEFAPIAPTRSHGLVDVLDRILDKGLVIAGDVRINLANVELLTIQVRLLVCSIDKAEEIGLTWWKTDPSLSGTARSAGRLESENLELRERLRALEERIERLAPGAGPAAGGAAPRAEEPPDEGPREMRIP
jgi:hypothetical protein